MTVGAAAPGIEFFDAVDLVRSKGRPIDPGMALLSALFARTSCVLVLGRLDDVAGWGLRRVGRILARLGEFLFQVFDALVKRLDLRVLLENDLDQLALGETFQCFGLPVIHTPSIGKTPRRKLIPWRKMLIGGGGVHSIIQYSRLFQDPQEPGAQLVRLQSP